MPEKYSLPTVAFDSELVMVAFELERLRGNQGLRSTPPRLLNELHSLFQLLMSVVSARIEGNRTTVFDAIQGVADAPEPSTQHESIREITNIMSAMRFIDQLDPSEPVTHVTVRELHRISVAGLVREGDPTPGDYRSTEVAISAADHVPPSHVYVHAEMTDWLKFVNLQLPTAQQMIHVALAHHRFLWIHPFRNGNGRVSRLLSYAMLRHHGFESTAGLRAVNPTAVFGNDREGYYSSLAAADDLSNAGAVEWCTFFVRGIHADMLRLEQLSDYRFVLENLLFPALTRLRQIGEIDLAEEMALRIALDLQVVKAGDLSSALPGSPSSRSNAIRSMLDRGLLAAAPQGPRFYHVPITRPPFATMVVRQLDVLGFLPNMLRDDA